MATETPHRAPEHDELQALIEEARHRARRRRRRQAVLFLTGTILVLGCVLALLPGDRARLGHHRPPAARAAVSTGRSGCVQSARSFAALAFPDVRDGWVVASPALAYDTASPMEVLRTVDEGTSWTCQWHARLIAAQLLATSRRDAWVLAWQGPACGDPTASAACRSVVAGTRNGRRWTVLSRPSQRFTQLAFASSTVGLAAARTRICGTVNGLPPRHCPGRVMLTRDGGRRWHPVVDTPGPIVAVAVSGATFWAVETRLGLSGKSQPNGGPGLTILVSHDGGRSWSPAGSIDLWLAGPREQVQLLPGRGGQLWLSVFDPDGCAMHGCSPDDVYVSSDGGVQWKLADPRELRGGPPGGGCGQAGPTGLAVDPSGGAWATTSTPLAACSGPATTLFRARASAGSSTGPAWVVSHRWAAFEPAAQAWPTTSTGFLLGAAGLTRSTDGGRSWTQLLPAPAPADQLQVTGPLTAYAAQDTTDQGAVLQTGDGGQHWRVLAHLPGMLTSLSFSSPRTGWAAGAVWVPNVGPRWNLYGTTSSPTRWRRLTALRMRPGEQVAGLWMNRPGDGLMLTSHGFIWPQLQAGVGPVTLMQTTNRGQNWTVVSHLPVTRDAVFGGASFVPVGRARWDGWMLIAPSRIEATTNTGRSWQLLAGTPPVDGIDRVTRDFGVAWNGPHNGRLELWQTADGGRRWQTLPLPRDLSQGHISNQQPVYASFATPAVGWLVANGSSWRTTNDGQSWQQSQP